MSIRKFPIWLALALLCQLGCSANHDNKDTVTGTEESTSFTDTSSGTDGTDSSSQTDTETQEHTDTWECVLDSTDPDFAKELGCVDDYKAVGSEPLSGAIPGAQSVKTVIDRLDGNELYFQNSRRYPIHFDFASQHLSGDGLPIVPTLSEFNQTEYFSPDRRFILGAVNYYAGPDVWAYEIAPYDTASAEMIQQAFETISAHGFFGWELLFHPTSDNVAKEAEKLGTDVPIITTDELFAGVDYQPLNLGSSMGTLRFFTASDVETEYLSFRDIVVLDGIPNDISVCSGIVTAEFQTPLAHINVLSQNRGTPNMGLRGAFTNEELRALEGKWVELKVGAYKWSIKEVTKAEADEWWNEHKPGKVQVPKIDLSVTELTDVEDVLDMELGLGPALAKAIPAFGGKASHYGAFPHMTAYAIPYPKAFVVPVYYYDQFMRENGFTERVKDMIADEEFQSDPAVRKASLLKLQDDIEAAPVNAAFEATLRAKLDSDFPGTRMKLRSSTNAEDLDGFTGAGLYTSKAYDPNDPAKSLLNAVRKVWASVWGLRPFDEREYRSISHEEVAMALLVHRSFPTEDSNGVAVTSNIFDPKCIEPGYYINGQVGDTSVVIPPQGVSSDQFIYMYDTPGQPIVFIDHSSLIAEGQTVLTRAQTIELGKALRAIHEFFNPLYGPHTEEHFFAMDVEWKFNTDPGKQSELVIKQARPYPGRGK